MLALNVEYVVFDVETTGLSPKKGDRIIEIGAVRSRNGKILDTFESFINPERALDKGAQMVNNITDEMVESAPKADIILPQFIDFIQGACLVAHNAKFDLEFICYQLAKFSRRLNAEIPVLDTLKMGKSLFPCLNSHKLESLARYLGISVKETHRALSDVKITAELLHRLLIEASEQGMESFARILQIFGVEKPKYPFPKVKQASLF